VAPYLWAQETVLIHRIQRQSPHTQTPPPIETEPDVLDAFLSDAAHVPGGVATGVATPHNADQIAALIRGARRILPIGAQSSLTGGATPRGDLVISTRALTDITRLSGQAVRVGAGVPLAELQRALASDGLYYPPVPTYDGAFVGGTIATNAAGAATFKYGSTRHWVDALSAVLADGSLIEIQRGEVTASPGGWFEFQAVSGEIIRSPVPAYAMPDVAKLSAGYFAHPGMDLIDLFIGSEGTLGVVTAATLRVISLPRRCTVLVTCASDRQAIAVTSALRHAAMASWRGDGTLDVSAIEFMDSRALSFATDEVIARAGIERPSVETVLLLVQIEVADREDDALHRLSAVLNECGVHCDPKVALPGDERGAARLFELREAVPAGVNGAVAAAKSRVHGDIEKIAGDFVVPFERQEESLALYRQTLQRYGLEYALWGHISDGNMHPNVLPRSLVDVGNGKAALLEIARRVVAMGGAPLAEHGVGRNALKQQLLRELYGDKGIEEMRAVKRALDPEWKLAAGVLFPEPKPERES
jgi:D-lactate dehydrogenase (cytochrome)